MNFTTFALWIAGASAVFAESTWGGLTFGMTAKEVSEKLGGHVKQEPDRADAPFISFSLTDPISVGDEQGSAWLQFRRATERLYMVALNFSAAEPRQGACFSSSTPANDVKKIRRLEVIGNGLIERYGKPASESGNPWPSSERLIRYFTYRELDAINSKRIWKDSGQAIEADVSLICGSLFLNVVYRTVGTEL